MRRQDRDRFDRLVEQVLAELPDHLHDLLAEAPLIVEDQPPADVDPDAESLCGLYSGVPLTERSVEDSATLPDQIVIYRRGVQAAADSDSGAADDAALAREIRITILHEIGHHFGMDEEQLRRYGYE